MAVETVEVLRKHGLKGIYGLILRKEFLAAADLLCRVLGINKTAWPLSAHELSAAIFYALAQHRALRGIEPEREHVIHTFRVTNNESEGSIGEETTSESRRDLTWTQGSPPREQRLARIHEECAGKEEKPRVSAEASAADEDVKGSVLAKWDSTVSDNSVIDETDTYNPKESTGPDLLSMENTTVRVQKPMLTDELPFAPVCDPVPDTVLSSLLFYAPIALNFIYAEREVDMQLLAAQQGWRILYAHLQQDCHSEGPISDRPASALFLHKEQKIACFAVRGTTTINDVVTDIRQLPVPFPETETDVACAGGNARFDDDWTPIFRGQGLAVCGMARAAVNLYREHIDVLVLLVKHGYRIRITGHSLGGGVATLLGALVLRHFEQTATQEGPDMSSSEHVPIERSDLLRVYGYGSPSCVDAELSDYVKSFVTTVVLHDDVIPRLTPTSIRGLLKHLLHIRETWVKMHLADDLRAISDRAKTAWAPRWRGSFTIGDSSSVKRYCRKQIQNGKKKLLLSVKGSVVGKTIIEENREERKSLHEEPDFCNSVADLNVQQSTDQPSVGFMRDDSAMDFEFERNSSNAEEEYMPEEEARGAELGTTLLVDYMGGIDKRTEGLVIDGDEFFDTEETLIENEDEESTEDNLSLLGPIPLER